MEFTKENLAFAIKRMQKLGLNEKESMKALALGKELLSLDPNNLKKPRYKSLNEVLEENRNFDIEEIKSLLNTKFNN